MTTRIRHFFEMLYLLVQKELKVRYKSSILGYLWAVANPFAFALVYYIAFKLIMRVKMENYSIFLLTGMFPWMWLTNALTQTTTSYINNASLVKKVNMNRAVLPLSNVIHEMVHFFFALPVLALFMKCTGNSFFTAWFWQIPLMLFLQLILIYPVSLALAISNVYVRDVEYLIAILLSMLFFLTPIVYSLSMIPAQYLIYFQNSPLALLIGLWRNVFLNGHINSINYCICTGIALFFNILTALFYHSKSPKLGELL